MHNKEILILVCCVILNLIILKNYNLSAQTLPVSLKMPKQNKNELEILETYKSLIKKTNDLEKTKSLKIIEFSNTDQKKIIENLKSVLQGYYSKNLNAEKLNELNNFKEIRFETIDDYLLILPSSSEYSIHGFYVFKKTNNTKKNIIMSPHSRFDQFTGNIALDIFFKNDNFDIFFSNLAHRHYSEDNDFTAENIKADTARNKNLFFNILTKTIVELFKNCNFIQIHGFNIDKWKTNQKLKQITTKNIIIASSGKNKTWHFTGDYIKDIDLRILSYPTEIDILAGTQNATLSVLKNTDAKFYHLELSNELRTLLNSDKNKNVFLIDFINKKLIK